MCGGSCYVVAVDPSVQRRPFRLGKKKTSLRFGCCCDVNERQDDENKITIVLLFVVFRWRCRRRVVFFVVGICVSV